MSPHGRPASASRELRDHLSKHLAQAKEGREAVVTEHGRPVARLVPSTPAQDPGWPSSSPKGG
jgi:prevent-host-death family protein